MQIRVGRMREDRRRKAAIYFCWLESRRTGGNRFKESRRTGRMILHSTIVFQYPD
jgi:hypothetical protein